MKRFFAITLCVAMALSLSACSSKSEPLTDKIQLARYKEYLSRWGNSSRGVITAYYPVLNAFDESAKRFPKLNEIVSEINEDMSEEVLDDFEELADAAEKRYDKFAEGKTREEAEAFKKTEFNTNAFVTRADGTALSVISESYLYIGDGDGITKYEGHNYSTETGEEIELDEVVTDADAFMHELKLAIVNKYSGERVDTFTQMDAVLDEYARDINEFKWALGPEGITILFDSGEIASVDEGSFSVYIRFVSNEETFAAKYKDTQLEDYVMPVLTADIVTEDLDLPENSINIEEFMIHKDGFMYLYVFHTIGNEYPMLEVYLIAEAYDKVNFNYMCLAQTYDDDRNLNTAIPVDPECMHLGMHQSFLSTYDGMKTYKTGDDGFPVSDDKYFRCPYPIQITLLKDIVLPSVDENGDEIEKAKLKAGDQFLIYRNDGVNQCDIKSADGHIYRVTIDNAEYPYHIGEDEETEVFSGINYAG